MNGQDVFLQSVLGGVALVAVIHGAVEQRLLFGSVTLLVTLDVHEQAAARREAGVAIWEEQGSKHDHSSNPNHLS